MRIMAIDPGPTESAWVIWDGQKVEDFGKAANAYVLQGAGGGQFDHLVIEMIACYGMAVGKEVFETCVWIGRYIQAFDRSAATTRITRIEVKSHLCHSGKANDSNIRQAIIDRFGGKDIAIGKKKSPGPLFGISGDSWAALSVALTWWDNNAPCMSPER